MFSYLFGRSKRTLELENFMEDYTGEPQGSEDSESRTDSSPAPDFTEPLSFSPSTRDQDAEAVDSDADAEASKSTVEDDEENDGTFPQQTPVAQYSMQGSLMWDIGPRTYIWLAGYGLLRYYGDVAKAPTGDGDGV